MVYVAILFVFWGVRGTVSAASAPVAGVEAPVGEGGKLVGHTKPPAASSPLAPASSAPVFGASLRAAVEETVSRIFRSASLRSFLLSDALAVVGNSCITALFPLFCRMAIGTSQTSVTLKLFPRGIAPGWLLEQKEMTIEPATQIPLLYAVFYVTGALCGPAWAWTAARVDISHMWQVETVIYTAALGSLLLAKTYWHTVLCTLAMGISVSGFSMLPELLLARLVDEASELHPSGAGTHAQAIVAAKSVGRRMASALQGGLVGWLLHDIGYAPGLPRAEQLAGVGGWLRFLTVAIPTLFFALSASALSWYTLGAPGLGSTKAAVQSGVHGEDGAAETEPQAHTDADDQVYQSLSRRRGASSIAVD
jgi:hypothetical protein